MKTNKKKHEEKLKNQVVNNSLFNESNLENSDASMQKCAEVELQTLQADYLKSERNLLSKVKQNIAQAQQEDGDFRDNFTNTMQKTHKTYYVVTPDTPNQTEKAKTQYKKRS